MLFVLDVGGGPVEIGSGVSGLAYAWVLGRRQESELLDFRPQNVSWVNLGSTLFHIKPSFSVMTYAYSLHTLVRLAWLQWRQRVWCQPPSNFRNLEFNDCRHFRRHCLVYYRFQNRTTMEHGWLLLWYDFWTCRCNSLFWICISLGFYSGGCVGRSSV